MLFDKLFIGNQALVLSNKLMAFEDDKPATLA